jgi:UDP-glucose 6-dehydrogenase
LFLGKQEAVLKVIPKAKYADICTSAEAEVFKYTHNASGYTQVILFNLMYDLAQKFGANWDVVQKAIQHDPMIPTRYSNPVHKKGRGAGGGCFIKDVAALRGHVKKNLPEDLLSLKVLEAMEAKNIHLLMSSDKDLDLLEGVYGKEKLAKHAKTFPKASKQSPKKRR